MRTVIDLDGHVGESGEILEPLLVSRRRLRRIGNDRHDHGGMAGTDLPEMQIGQPVATGLDALADALRQRRIGHRVEQDATGGADQADQDRITSMPTRPTSGPMKFRPNAQAADRPAIANTEVSASARTCT